MTSFAVTCAVSRLHSLTVEAATLLREAMRNGSTCAGLLDFCNETEIKSIADSMVSTGMKDLGYDLVFLGVHPARILP